MIANTNSGHGNFGGTVKYIFQKEKCQNVWTQNLIGSTPEEIAAEMAREVEAINQGRPMHEQVKTPVYHVSISWSESDQPTPKEQMDVGRAYLEHMGLAGHQAIIAIHGDTSHPHIHIVANRVNSETGRTWEAYSYNGKGKDRTIDKTHYQRQEEFLREAERNYGWTITPGRHAGEWDRSFDGRLSLTQGEYHFSQKANDIAEALGMQEAELRPIKERAADVKEALFQAKNFGEFDKALATQGLFIQAKGQGAIISDGSHSVKASSISRQLSGPKLEATFGESLKSYVEEREKAINESTGRQQIQAWMQQYEGHVHETVSGESHSMRAAHEGSIRDIDGFRQEVNPPREQFQRNIASGYKDPEKALENITRRSADVGLAQTAKEIWEDPGRFGTVADRHAVGRAGEALGAYREKSENYPSWMKSKTDQQLMTIRATHVRQLSGWNDIKNAARHRARESQGGQVADKSVSSVIGISRAARELAKNPEKTPLKASHKLLKKARSQMKTDGGQAAGTLMKGTKQASVTAATLLSSPGQGGMRLMQHIISGGAGTASRAAERNR